MAALLKHSTFTVQSLRSALHLSRKLCGVNQRITEASKRSAALLLHEPLSYNTAGFLFSCLNTFYMLSARTRLNNLEWNAREETPEKDKEQIFVLFFFFFFPTTERFKPQQITRGFESHLWKFKTGNLKSVSFQQKGGFPPRSPERLPLFVIPVSRSSASALRDSCSMVIISYLNNEAIPPLLPPIPSASLTGLFDRH